MSRFFYSHSTKKRHTKKNVQRFLRFWKKELEDDLKQAIKPWAPKKSAH